MEINDLVYAQYRDNPPTYFGQVKQINENSVWIEDTYMKPPKEFVQQADGTYKSKYGAPRRFEFTRVPH